MQNVIMKVENNKLIIEVDLTKSFGPSKSGKTTVIASTQGNQKINGAGAAGRQDEVMVGLNVYKYPPRS